ncbi:hypothetical protein EZZ81_00870 [Pseudomonas viridiflava]|uniref:Uncharacterized protein n=1 Tax=Pseudomonas viridiflava TaxID=33069 RepID=A0AA46VUS8_PSEVI|nr:hypothetical protein EZZ81_00870 [Pseudomonas viridiflava]
MPIVISQGRQCALMEQACVHVCTRFVRSHWLCRALAALMRPNDLYLMNIHEMASFLLSGL